MLIKNHYFDCKFVCFCNHFDCFLADGAIIRGSVPYMDATLFYITKNIKENKGDFKNGKERCIKKCSR